MAFNFLELASQFNQFQQLLKKSNQNPQELLNAELKKRNLSPDQINQLMNLASTLKPLLRK